MYATIRRYPVKGDTTARATVEQLKRQVQDEFLPILNSMPGFHGYYMIRSGPSELVTLSLFDTEQGAADSNRRAAEYVRRAKLPVELGPPEILQGEVLTHREVAVGV
jgi:heme-degrading monooxygenase HmoA